MKITRRYGWKPGEKDKRDFKLALGPAQDFPNSFTLRPLTTPVYDQKDEGSCVWNGLAIAHQFCQLQQPGGTLFMPSRNYGYYWTRVKEGTVNEDAGCVIRNAAKVYNKRGCCTEDEWVYDRKNMFTQPPASCDVSALKRRALRYDVVTQTERGIMSCLYGQKGKGGFPVVFGSLLYESFESKDTVKYGIVTMPKKNEEPVGGHCMTIIGWKRTPRQLWWEVRNSWGPKVGDQGHLWFPAQYLTDRELSSDFWRFTLVEE